MWGQGCFSGPDMRRFRDFFSYIRVANPRKRHPYEQSRDTHGEEEMAAHAGADGAEMAAGRDGLLVHNECAVRPFRRGVAGAYALYRPDNRSVGFSLHHVLRVPVLLVPPGVYTLYRRGGGAERDELVLDYPHHQRAVQYASSGHHGGVPGGVGSNFLL